MQHCDGFSRKNLKWVWKKKTSIRCQHDAESQLEYITRSADAKLLLVGSVAYSEVDLTVSKLYEISKVLDTKRDHLFSGLE